MKSLKILYYSIATIAFILMVAGYVLKSNGREDLGDTIRYSGIGAFILSAVIATYARERAKDKKQPPPKF